MVIYLINLGKLELGAGLFPAATLALALHREGRKFVNSKFTANSEGSDLSCRKMVGEGSGGGRALVFFCFFSSACALA